MKTILTHNGKFHADDVFAVATLMLAYPNEKFKVVRSRDAKLEESADFVVDVGGKHDGKKLFDHHQTGGAGMHENKIPFASFGLVWEEFGVLACEGDFFVKKQIEDSLVSSLDAHDNGVKIYQELYPVSPFELSEYVGAFNPTWLEEEEGEKDDENRLQIFLTMVEWAKKLIQREVKRYKDKNSAFNFIKQIYEKSPDKHIIVLDKYMPWGDALLEYPDPKFVIYPHTGGDAWAAKTVPKSKHSFESRVPFPSNWAGKRDAELAKESGVEDALFCHNKLFLATAKSREGAIKLAELAISQQ